MKNKKVLNDKGLTLVELLAVIVLFAMIGIFVTSLIVRSIDTTKEIQIETQFRDEADLIMSNFIKTIYEMKQTNIANFDTTTGNSYIQLVTNFDKCKKKEDGSWELTDECKGTLKNTGFKTDNGKLKLYFNGEEYTILNPNIEILNNSKMVKKNDNSYEIILSLQYKGQRSGKEYTQKMEFKNTIQPF